MEESVPLWRRDKNVRYWMQLQFACLCFGSRPRVKGRKFFHGLEIEQQGRR